MSGAAVVILRKCAWVNHLFTTCLGEKLLEIGSDRSKLWLRKLRKIACFRKSPENSKMLETCSNPVRVIVIEALLIASQLRAFASWNI